eukprot:m.54208 g.54208  ORF g.54208 m.54208 type:complete len:135 (+) comp15491_c0_seq1:71-475(+)
MTNYLPHCFDLFDKNGEGSIPAASLGPALRALGKAPSEEQVQEMLAGASSVNLEQFTAFAGQVEEPAKDDVMEAFATFDTNNNGYIALPELKHLMKSLGEGLSDAEIQGLVKVAAADDEDQVNIRHLVDQLMQD